jgi:UDP-N-acetyl-D-galactosamine dehydrogenase
VGGHCIGVDPYYLAQKAQEYGYHPEIILAGRRMNDGMGEYVASRVVKCMIQKTIPVKNAKVLVLGITFKENCPDVRNTKVVDILKSLNEYGMCPDVYDPWASASEVEREYGVTILQQAPHSQYDVIVLAVAHQEFLEMNIPALLKSTSVLYDVKSILNLPVDGRL